MYISPAVPTATRVGMSHCFLHFRETSDHANRYIGHLQHHRYKRAGFLLQSLLRLHGQLEAKNSKLHICYGKPEEVLVTLPPGSEVKRQSEPVFIEQIDALQFVQRALSQREDNPHRDHGAMNLYHPHCLPFRHHEQSECFSALSTARGWKDIWTSTEPHASATPIRKIVRVPSS